MRRRGFFNFQGNGRVELRRKIQANFHSAHFFYFPQHAGQSIFFFDCQIYSLSVLQKHFSGKMNLFFKFFLFLHLEYQKNAVR